MKKLLILSLPLLSLGAFANERVFLGSFDYRHLETPDGVAELSMTGYGARFYNFSEDSFYFAASFTNLTGDVEVSAPGFSVSGDYNETIFGGEIGWNTYDITTFAGVYHRMAEQTLLDETVSDERTGFSTGLWFSLQDFKLRGVMHDVQDSANRSIAGGLLYQMGNNLVVGAEVELLVDQPASSIGLSLYFGRMF